MRRSCSSTLIKARHVRNSLHLLMDEGKLCHDYWLQSSSPCIFLKVCRFHTSIPPFEREPIATLPVQFDQRLHDLGAQLHLELSIQSLVSCERIAWWVLWGRSDHQKVKLLIQSIHALHKKLGSETQLSGSFSRCTSADGMAWVFPTLVL